MFKLEELLKGCSGRFSRPGKAARISGISIDSRAIKRGEAFIAIRGKNFDGHDFIARAVELGASCVIHDAKTKIFGNVKAGVPFIEVRDTEKALGMIANFQRRKFDPPVIAVTGSTGKTTCKEMIACVLGSRLRVLKNEGTKNNQIGVPMTLLGLDAGHEAVILELGTNHFGEIARLAEIAEPNIAVITNIGSSHLEYFGNRAGVWREKRSILENLRKPGIAVLNADDPFQAKVLRSRSGGFVLSYGGRGPADILVSEIKPLAGRVDFLVNGRHRFQLNTVGIHNVYNAAAACAVGLLFGVSLKESSRRLKRFKFPGGRLNLCRINGVTFLDDTYNSNPSSFAQALAALKDFPARGRRILVMGDMLELGKNARRCHEEAGKLLKCACDVFIACGKLSGIAAGKAALDRKNIHSCLTSSQARDILWNRICPEPSDVVLVKGSRAMKMEEVMK